MVTITKKEAFDRFCYNKICKFHQKYPDQQAILETCEDCINIEDECGCGLQDNCEICCPWCFSYTKKIKLGRI